MHGDTSAFTTDTKGERPSPDQPPSSRSPSPKPPSCTSSISPIFPPLMPSELLPSPRFKCPNICLSGDFDNLLVYTGVSLCQLSRRPFHITIAVSTKNRTRSWVERGREETGVWEKISKEPEDDKGLCELERQWRRFLGWDVGPSVGDHGNLHKVGGRVRS